jgi:hypothetical protein
VKYSLGSAVAKCDSAVAKCRGYVGCSVNNNGVIIIIMRK